MYSGIDNPSQWVLSTALDEAAEATPGRVWVMTTDGEQLTFGSAADETRRSAGFFAHLGIRSGDRVAIMLPNWIEFIRVWLGLNRLGAVPVFINSELRGAFLKHQIAHSALETAVVHSQSLASIVELDVGASLRRIVCIGGDSGSGQTGVRITFTMHGP